MKTLDNIGHYLLSFILVLSLTAFTANPYAVSSTKTKIEQIERHTNQRVKSIHYKSALQQSKQHCYLSQYLNFKHKLFLLAKANALETTKTTLQLKQLEVKTKSSRVLHHYISSILKEEPHNVYLG